MSTNQDPSAVEHDEAAAPSSPKKARVEDAEGEVLTEAERRKRRAERFHNTLPAGGEESEERRRKRAERFGLSTPELEKEKKNQRAERFGIVDPKKKLEERKQRFGIVKDSEKRELRAKRFGPTKDDDKKKLRAERFAAKADSASSSSAEGPHLTAKVNVPTAQRLGLPIKSNE